MSYNTGNPVPSKDPRDLVDNAENLDRAVNGEAVTFDDRLGKQRKSWAGIERDFADFLASSGFEPVHLVYQDGVALTVDRPTQLINYGGSVYRVKMPSDFPVSLSGTWATDNGLLVDIGDQSLRSQLASPTGAAMVGVAGGNLESFVNAYNAMSFSALLNSDLGAARRAKTAGYHAEHPGVGCAEYVRNGLTGTPSTGDFLQFYDANGDGWAIVPAMGVFITPDMGGAIPDASNNAGAICQAIMDYWEAQERHGALFLTGRYLVDQTISGRSYASIVGPGELVAAAGLNAPVVEIYAAYGVRRISGTSYKGFKIDGNKTGQTTTDPRQGAGFVLRCDVENPNTNGDPNHSGEIEDIRVDDITVTNAKTSGFYFGKTTFSGRSYEYSKLAASGCVDGIYLDDFCEYITFIGSNVQRNQHGVRDNGSSNISFLGGDACNNTEAGIYFATTGRNTFKKTVSGMRLNHNKRGVWLGAGMGSIGEPIDQVAITSCQILANSWQGVVGSRGDNVLVTGNIFSGNGEGGNQAYDDINIAVTCKGWSVRNNIFRNSTGKTRHAVYYTNPAAAGINGHTYHDIGDNQYIGHSTPVSYTQAGSAPSTTPINANTNTIDGVFEYWNTAGQPPSATAANVNASVNLARIKAGTICINNATPDGSERWLAFRTPSSSGASNLAFARLT